MKEEEPHVNLKKVFKENHNCKSDEEINPDTNKCRKKCNDDQERNPDTKKCRKKCNDDQERNQKGICVKKTNLDIQNEHNKANTKKVHKPKSPKILECKPNQEINPKTKRCRKKCNDDQERNKKGICVKNKSPNKSPSKSPSKSHNKSHSKSHNKSHNKSPNKSPNKSICWKKKKQLGESGKEGTCYRVINNLTNEEFAMKEFKPKKSNKKFDSEVSYQRKAGELGIGPKVIGVMYYPPRIVMEMMNRTIEQVIKDQNGILTDDQQNDIISLCKKMDENNIYHCDPNPLNLMEGFDGKFKWIDYGMTKDINVKKHTNNPNLKALKYVFYSGMQGLISRKIIDKDNINLINKKINEL